MVIGKFDVWLLLSPKIVQTSRFRVRVRVKPKVSVSITVSLISYRGRISDFTGFVQLQSVSTRNLTSAHMLLVINIF